MIKIETKDPSDQIFFIKDHKVGYIDEAIDLVMTNQMKVGAVVN